MGSVHTSQHGNISDDQVPPSDKVDKKRVPSEDEEKAKKGKKRKRVPNRRPSRPPSMRR